MKNGCFFKTILTFILLSFTLAGLQAKESNVKFLYDVDFLFYFDNREYDRNPYQNSGTAFGVRLSPEIGFGITDSAGASHKVMAGVSYNQPIGTDWKEARLYPTAYYKLGYKGLDLNLGFVPYKYLIQDLPDYLLYDSLAYCTPNVQGLLVQYKSNHGFVSALCDWRGAMTAETREAFRIIITGRYEYKFFNIGGYAMLNHLANPEGVHLGVCDDILVNPYIGFDFSKITPLDSLSIRAGYMFGVQRDRDRNLNFLTNSGNIEIFLRWKYIGFKNTTYFGDNLFPLYKQYGLLLNLGDPFYQANIYNRTDIFVYFYNNRFVNCYGSFNIHITEEGSFNCQQQIIAQFNLANIFDKNKKNKMKSLFGK